jgi:hypothetical protein
MDSPFHNASIPASSVHYLINGSPAEREGYIMRCLSVYHGISHVSEGDIDAYKYKLWKAANPDIHKRLLSLEVKDSEEVPEFARSSINCEIGVDQELKALKMFEKTVCAKLGDNYVVVSDQARRELKVGDNIKVIGRIDGMLATDVGDKRTYKGVVEVKTRVKGFRDNPADLTQLTLYSRMIPNARHQLYILVEYDPYKEEIKRTTYKYEQVEEHWNNVVYPGLKLVYPDLCATWKRYTDPSDPNYVGTAYRKSIFALIDKFLAILNVPDMEGDIGLISLLETSKIEIDKNLKGSYESFARCITPEAIVRVQNRELAFFEQNLKSFLNLNPKQKDQVSGYVDKYLAYIAGIVKDNVTEKTRESLWKLVEDVLSSLSA